jgi:hypothetical protein
MRLSYVPSPPTAQVHGNAAACANCGKSLTPKRGSRRQRFCNGRCRDQARRSRNNAVCGRARYPSGPVPRSVKNPPEISNDCKPHFAGRGSVDKALWHDIVELEVFAGRTWCEIVSADGVVSQVAVLRPPVLRGPVS